MKASDKSTRLCRYYATENVKANLRSRNRWVCLIWDWKSCKNEPAHKRTDIKNSRSSTKKTAQLNEELNEALGTLLDSHKDSKVKHTVRKPLNASTVFQMEGSQQEVSWRDTHEGHSTNSWAVIRRTTNSNVHMRRQSIVE